MVSSGRLLQPCLARMTPRGGVLDLLSNNVAGPSRRPISSAPRRPLSTATSRSSRSPFFGSIFTIPQSSRVSCPRHAAYPLRAFSTTPRNRFPPPDQALPAENPPQATSNPTAAASRKHLDDVNPAVNTDAASLRKTEKAQTDADWRIILKLAENIWPKNSPGTKVRVLGALLLLVGGKVLNVQVPFFFKQIVDALNVPITAETTVWVLAGTAIAGCESERVDFK